MTYNDVIHAVQMIAELRELDELIAAANAPGAYVQTTILCDETSDGVDVPKISAGDIAATLMLKRSTLSEALNLMSVWPDPTPLAMPNEAPRDIACNGSAA